MILSNSEKRLLRPSTIVGSFGLSLFSVFNQGGSNNITTTAVINGRNFNVASADTFKLFNLAPRGVNDRLASPARRTLAGKQGVFSFSISVGPPPSCRAVGPDDGDAWQAVIDVITFCYFDPDNSSVAFLPSPPPAIDLSRKNLPLGPSVLIYDNHEEIALIIYPGGPTVPFFSLSLFLLNVTGTAQIGVGLERVTYKPLKRGLVKRKRWKISVRQTVFMKKKSLSVDA